MKKSELSDEEIEKRVDAFGLLIHAGMMDAAVERKLSQFVAEITPEGHTKPSRVRIIIVPETMDIERPRGFTT